MFRKQQQLPTVLKVNTSYLGESIEQKIRRLVNNKEPIGEETGLIYTERKDGVRPEYDIRTDRNEIALDAMTAVSKTFRYKRNEKHGIGEEAKEGMEKESKTEDGKAKPAAGNDPKEA